MVSKIVSICKNNECVGCALCQSVCKQNAITINSISGFYRPEINNNCIGCGMCVQICPSNSKVEFNNHTPKTCYAAWSNDESVHYNSSSGGIAFSLADQFIENGGFVVGVWFNPKKQQVEHRIYENKEDLERIRGSKYVHSNKTGIYKKALEMLKNKNGLFIGVPCEVYAMKKFIVFSNENTIGKMFYIDLLCRGGSSPKCLEEHIKKVVVNKKIDNISFRGGKYDCQFTLWKNNKVVYRDWQLNDVYFELFMRHTLLQPACFSCQFVGSRRLGDITLGDFWGLDEAVLKETKIQGTNMVMVNNNDGSLLIEMIRGQITLIERDIEEAINGNDTLKSATLKEAEYDDLWNEISKNGFHKAVKHIYGVHWKKRHLAFLYFNFKTTIKKYLLKIWGKKDEKI